MAIHGAHSGKVVVAPQRRALFLKYDDRVVNLVPHAKQIVHNGVRLLALPNGEDEVKLLRNLDYDVPGPIRAEYDWCGIKAFYAQQVTADMLSMNTRAYVLNGMGSGKTLAALFAADYLMRKSKVQRALIVAPLSTLNVVWAQEIFNRMPHRTSVVLHGTRQKRQWLLDQDANFYIINHDGVGTILEDLNVRPDLDLVIIDELAALRNARTDRWKTMRSLLSKRKYVWGMTGSPTPNAPTDAWAQVRLLTPWQVPKYFKAWRDSTMYQVTSFRWEPRKTSKEIVFRAMQPAVRFALSDCVDLPPTTYSQRQVDMTPAQKKAFVAMKADMAIELANGMEITAVNAGVQVSKLLQISCGFIYDKKHEVHLIPATPRLEELKDIIEEADAKVIVFVPFVEALQSVSQYLSAAGYTNAIIHGDTTAKERTERLTLFQHSLHPRVLVAHPQVAAHGLTLTAANVIVWFSPTTSPEHYEQANARIPRPGQTLNTHVIHLQASPTEARLYRALEKKLSLQAELLALFKEMTQ